MINVKDSAGVNSTLNIKVPFPIFLFCFPLDPFELEEAMREVCLVLVFSKMLFVKSPGGVARSAAVGHDEPSCGLYCVGVW